jgi:hypothetical protein
MQDSKSIPSPKREGYSHPKKYYYVKTLFDQGLLPFN